MNRKKAAGLAIVCLALAFAVAAVSLMYMIEPAVVDSGGGRATSPGFQAQVSVGGPALGGASSANYSVEVGGVALVEGGASGPGPGPAPQPPDGGGDGGGCSSGTAGAGNAGATALLALWAAAFLRFLRKFRMIPGRSDQAMSGPVTNKIR